jgi:predicted nucleotidyltransferase
MVGMNDIQELSRRIAHEFQPRRIVLFGSHAHGQAGPDSDADLLVVVSHAGTAMEKSVDIRLKVRPRFPLDLILGRYMIWCHSSRRLWKWNRSGRRFAPIWHSSPTLGVGDPSHNKHYAFRPERASICVTPIAYIARYRMSADKAYARSTPTPVPPFQGCTKEEERS